MASSTAATGWLRGIVKAVPSGDTLLIMGSTKAEIPPEKLIGLSSITAPRLARRGGIDEPFAWDSKEYLRKLSIGKEVHFRVEYTAPSGREYGSIFLDKQNLAYLVVSNGWAKVKSSAPKGEVNPYLQELQNLEDEAKKQGLGCWNKAPEDLDKSVRDLPPSAIGDPSSLDATGLLAANKGKPMEAIVEQVRDGSTVRAYLLPDFQFVQVFVAGIQAPSMGRRAVTETAPETEGASNNAASGEASGETQQPLTSAQRLTASAVSSIEVSPEAFGREAKHFTEIRVLSRDVRIVLEGVDKFSNLIGSVYYPDGDAAKDLALELVQNGLAKFVEWSANMMEDDAKRKLKAAELQAKKDRLRMWTNYVPPVSNSKAIHDQNFSGKVVEVVSGDCIIVADDAVPYGSPLAERRVNLSSIRAPKMGRRDDKPAPYAREAREFLRGCLISQQVNVSMEYSRKVGVDGPGLVPETSGDSRIMDFGSVFLVSATKAQSDGISDKQQDGKNVAEMVVRSGLATVVKHRDFEERSNHYDALLMAESRAINGKKGIHSSKDPPVMHVTDLTSTKPGSAKKARDFLPFLQRARRHPAVVDYVLSGHRFKLFIPKETCSIAFSFSGVRCPNRGDPFSEEAIALMRRKILQRNVEIEVETVDRTGTFLGSLWESGNNIAVTLLEAGLAKLQTSFGADKIPDAHLLAHAEQSAKRQKLKIWENFVEGQEATNGSVAESKQKKVLKVVVTEVLGGGKFYAQTIGDEVSDIQKKLAELDLKGAPYNGFNPKKGDVVLAQFSLDNSWNRAMIVNAPREEGIRSAQDMFEVFYIDYGNQESILYSRLRPLPVESEYSKPGYAQLCRLAFIKVPDLEDDFGHEAAEYLSECTMNSSNEFRAMIEEEDASGGKAKGQGTGNLYVVTLVDVKSATSINAAMLQEGLARLEKSKRWDTTERKAALDNLEEFQAKAKRERLRIWQYGDVQSDDEETAPPPPPKKTGGRR